MDNFDCLKNFTENIVKRQNDSVESIERLSKAVDSISADISNLINSLLMVGNRQFAENKIQDDDSLIGEEQSVSDPQQMKHATPDSDLSHQSLELSLGSILNNALALLPRSEEVVDTNENNEVVSDFEDDQAKDNQVLGSLKWDDEVDDDHRSKIVKPVMDRDRVADILKKYSLYDDNEDDEEEESE